MIEVPQNASVKDFPASVSSASAAAGSFRYVVKDCVNVKGTPTSFGMDPPLIRCADSDAEIVTLLNANGGHLIAKTNLDELTLGCVGSNQHFGEVKNPLYPGQICGGSSSGSAAMVAAGCAELGVGTDWGGSVRIPALCCGIYGLKLTTQARFLAGIEHVDPSMSAAGFLASKVEDLSNILSLIGLEERESEADLRVGVAKEGLAAMEVLIDGSVAFPQVELPWSQARNCRKVLAAKAMSEFVTCHAIPQSVLPAQAHALLRFSTLPGFDRLVEIAISERIRITETVLRLMERSPVILCPGLGIPIPGLSDFEAIHRFSDSCTYFFEIANVADVSSLVFPARGRREGAQLLIRPGWERAAIGWLRRLCIPGEGADLA